MSTHNSSLTWTRRLHPDDPRTYSRDHMIVVGHEQAIAASAGSDYKGDPSAADPEQLLVAAISSCHMLFFLALAEAQGWPVDRYEDHATAYLEKDEGRHLSVKRIVLAPVATFPASAAPSDEKIALLHEQAHRHCFIARSVKCEIEIRLPDHQGHAGDGQ